ncbi:hypothetical protein SAMN05421780_107199 [Flexibacter flexilis DSM 6793]|uniref:Uncharacterized protein n=1 Tax=Flexibacter flexilis DSM 6793 TaxID=927664 RepID=A0A1I1KTE9_9BACT|nr:tetratricopeptide repeat protein [Flexibacter flexilis]SFC64011.1 hypothetical protein SAMN05421780_107199 [Flexibacter flexilis DSM 6793]
MKYKIFTTILIFLTCTTNLQAQNTSLSLAHAFMQKGELDNAMQAVEVAAVHPETANNPKTWYYKGWILKEKFKKQGMKDDNFSIRRTGSEAFAKSISLDTKAEYKSDCAKLIMYLTASLYNEGTDNFNDKKYKEAIPFFDEYIKEVSLLSTDSLDNSAYFYLGYSYYHEKNEAQAKKYLEKCRQLKYPDAVVYDFLGHIYDNEKKSAEALKTLEEGTAKYPKDKPLAITHVNVLMKNQKNKEAVTRIEKALQSDSKNLDLYLVLGTACERASAKDSVQKMMYLEKAQNAYKKALDLDSTNFMANYNYGIISYNKGVDQINNQSYDIDLLDLDKVLNQSTDLFKKALPYLERASRLKPENKNTLMALEGIYVHIQAEDKLAQVRTKLQK